MIDFGALPPEINSARMYAGPGPGSMLAAAAGWNGLAAELQSAASSYRSVISALTSGAWLGPSSTAMAAAAAPYAAWMSATAGQAELAATQALAAAGAHAAAFAATVSPPEIAANRAQLMTLVATNIFGQNTPAIATTEAQYGEMWAQDAAAMYGYAASSAATTAKVTPFTAAPQTTSTAGLAAQATAAAQTTGTSTGTGVQSTLSQLMSTFQSALQNLASPLSSALGGSSSSTVAPDHYARRRDFGHVRVFARRHPGRCDYLIRRNARVGCHWTRDITVQHGARAPYQHPYEYWPPIRSQRSRRSRRGGAGRAAPAALGSGFGGGFGGLPGLGALAGIGQAASVGGLSVPPNWGWATTAPAALLGSAPLRMPAVPLAGNDLGAGLGGFPMPFGGLGRAAAAGAAGGVAGAAAMKYLPRLKFLARPPAAGYSEEEPTVPPPAAKYPVPATFPTNGHAPPGYQPAIVYIPTTGHDPANK